jgi:hypothetical protein
MEAKSTIASHERKIARPEKEVKNSIEPAIAGNSRKDDLHKVNAARNDVSGTPERLQEHSADTVQGFPSVPGVKESAQPSDSEMQEDPEPPVAKDVSAAKATAESEPAIELQADKVLKPAPERLPANRTATSMQGQEPDAHIEPTRATNEEPLKQTLSKSAESLTDKKEKTYAPLPEPEPELEPLRLSSPQENYVHDAGTKTTPEGQPERPSIVPAAQGGRKYPAHALQPEETVVTINIGRIEVRAEMPAKPARAPKRRFSPSLSLADYLKHRSEGNAR